MVIANNYFLGLKFFYQNIANKLRCGQSGKSMGKRMDNQMVQSRFLKQLNALFNGVYEFQFLHLLKHHSGMGKKCEHNGIQILVFGCFRQAFQNCFMTNMDSVKSTYGDHALSVIFISGNRGIFLQNYFPLKVFIVMFIPAKTKDSIISELLSKRSGNRLFSSVSHSPKT